jgi:iron complex outermembrane receptor protein
MAAFAADYGGNHMRKSKQFECRTPAILTLAALATLAAGPGLAQAVSDDEGFILEEVVVTATKRSQKLLDVPVAISALSVDDILTRGLTQYADYLNGVPGVYFEDAGPGVSQIRMRGVVADEGGGASTVATYFGETVTSLYTNGGGKPNLRLVDIDRVEVLRGPQGTLFGANALTGVVRILPAAPDLQDFETHLGTRGFTTAQSDDESYHVEGTVNIPLVKDRLGLRLVAYKDDIAGYIDNVVPARDAIDYSAALGTPDGTLVVPANPAFTRKDVNSEDTWGARAALTWQATEQLRFDLSYATQDVTVDSEPKVEPGAGEYAQQREMDLFEEAKFTEDLDIGTLVVNYDFDAVSLISTTSFAKLQRTALEDASFVFENFFAAPIPSAIADDTQAELFTQEVRLQSRGEGALQWIVGAFYLDQQTDQNQSVGDYSCPTCIPALYGQDFAFRNAPGSDPRFLNLEQGSVFGEVSYSFAVRWTLGLGARYLEEDIEGLTPATEGYLADSEDGFAEAEPPRLGSSEEVNPSAYLRFKPSEDVTWYVQAARGFRSGRANERLSYTGDCAEEAAALGLRPLVDPDTLWSYELGTKSRIAGGRLGINAAIYRHDWKGVQLPTSLECGFGGTINGGDVQGEGVELETSVRVSDAWRLNLAAAYNRNEFENVRPATGYVKGERVPGAPEKNASAGVQYDLTLNAQWDGFARADYSYVGDARYKFGQGDNALIVMQDAYNTTSARLGLRRDNLSVDLFGRNLTDERAVVFTADPQLGNYEYLLRPREIGIELRYSFD